LFTSFLTRIDHNNALNVFLKVGTDSFGTLIWTTPPLLPVGSIHHFINKLVMGDTTSAANFLPYNITVLHKLCYIDHETEFCALISPRCAWWHKQSPHLFRISMVRVFISVN